MAGKLDTNSLQLGTMPVFLTSIATILGAILFLRFGYAVGHVGLIGTLGIVLLGHLVTIPTAMAVAEIATNSKVEGGGAYYMISRSFGLNIGAAIGIALFLSQAISVAFYVIAFTGAFKPFVEWLFTNYKFHPWADWVLRQNQTIAVPTLIFLTSLVIKKGADVGMKTLYIVVATLGLSLVAFFLGDPVEVKTDVVYPAIPEVSILLPFILWIIGSLLFYKKKMNS